MKKRNHLYGLNGNNDEYIVLFGSDRWNPESHFRTAKRRFLSLPAAREYARQFTNAAIYRLHYRIGDDLPTWREIE